MAPKETNTDPQNSPLFYIHALHDLIQFMALNTISMLWLPNVNPSLWTSSLSIQPLYLHSPVGILTDVFNLTCVIGILNKPKQLMTYLKQALLLSFYQLFKIVSLTFPWS